MWLPLLALILGFIALVWSADRFVSGAAATAKNLNVSKIVIGLTVVSIGTSAPEILVGLQASLDGASDLAIGNAIGSNIANIGLVLGITALIRPLPFEDSVLKSELPWLLGATFIAVACLFNRFLGILDGVVLLAGLSFVMYRLTLAAREGTSDPISEELDDYPAMSKLAAGFWLFAGLVVLLVASHVIVEAAVTIAEQQNVPRVVIGLTIVAIGTSLPELAATVGAAMKGHSELAIGNVVGSNILNILAVMAVPALVHPTAVDGEVLYRDVGMMLAITMLLALFAYGIGSRKLITRFEGGVLAAAWIGYNLMLFIQSSN